MPITDWDNVETRAVYTRLPLELLATIQEDACRNGRHVSFMIRRILEAHYQNRQEALDVS